VNQICKTFDLGLKVFELALEKPTKDITQEAAMAEADCAATMAYGMEAIAGGCDLLCIGEMGIGNTTIAAAICHGLYGGKPEDWAGPGTGVDAEGLKRKASAVARAVAFIPPISLIRLRFYEGWGAANWPQWLALFWPPNSARTSSARWLCGVSRCSHPPYHTARCAGPLPGGALFSRTSASQFAEAAWQGTGFDLGMRLGEASGAALAAGNPQSCS
jgi:nicotinate-nucleotide--dimethylbenzimidazole phosphoribosyltransferase